MPQFTTFKPREMPGLVVLGVHSQGRRMRARRIRRHWMVAFSMAVALVVLVVTMNPASAALWLQLDQLGGRPGAFITARTFGSGAFVAPLPELPRPIWALGEDAAVAGLETVPPEAEWLGDMTVDASGNGSLRFRVPDAAPGNYTMLVECDACVPYSSGRRVLPIGELVIEDACLTSEPTDLPSPSPSARGAAAYSLGE